MEIAILLGGLTTSGLALFALLRFRRVRPAAPLTRELRFGADLTAPAVEAVLAAMSGLPRSTTITLDTVADTDGVRWLIRTDRSTLDNLAATLRGLVPTARLSDAEAPSYAWRLGTRLSWSTRQPAIRTDQPAESAAALLATLVPLSKSEAILLRWSLAPVRVPRVPEPRTAAGRPSSIERLDAYLSGPAPTTEQARALRAKYAGPLLEATCLVAVAAGHTGRAAQLRERVIAALRSRRGLRGRLRANRLGGARLEHVVHVARPRGGQTFSPAEIAGVLGWPIGAPRLPGVSLGTAPLLMPARNIPSKGRVLAEATWPGQARSLAQSVTGALSHSLVIGPTGVGKSALLANLIAQDMAVGRGCLVLDGKGDLASDVLALIPPERAEQVIVLDPGAGGPVAGLRLFGVSSDPELAADLVLGIFRELFADSWGVRSEQWLRAGLVTLAHDREATLADLPFLFIDAGFRRRLVGRLRDPLLLATWAAFEAMTPAEQANQLGAPLNKVAQVVGRGVVRAVLAQPNPAIDMRRVLMHNQVVIVRLAPATLGTAAARLIGALVLHEFFGAVQARASLEPHQRRPFMAYIDEPRVLGDLPVPLDSLFETARGLGVAMTIAGQSVTQLPTHIRAAALTNAATLIAFRQSADDAAVLARQLPGVSADDLQHLPQYEVAMRIGLGPGDVSSPVTGRTLPPPKAISDPAAVRRASVERHGIDPALVDARLAERHPQVTAPPMPAPDDVPVGRQRRAS